MKRTLQFSIRFAILTMTLFACVVGLYYRKLAPFYAEHAAILALTKIGSVRVEYVPARIDPVSRWILGQSYSRHVSSLILRGAAFDDRAMRHLRAFRHLRSLQLWWLKISCDGLTHIPVNRNLEGLGIRFILLNPGYVRQVIRFAPNVKRLRLEATGLTDTAVKTLMTSISITHLSLQQESITDASLPYFAGQRDLELLDIAESEITDAVLLVAQALPRLSYLCVMGTQVSQDGHAQLRVLANMRRGFSFDPVVWRP